MIKSAGIMAKLAATGLLVCSLAGCIRSRVTITSDPPQAEVTWLGEPRGVTPITIPIKWYWYYDFTLEKEGYEKIDRVEYFRTPPWFLMPLDIFAEIIPIPIRDSRERHFKMTKKEAKPF